MLDRMRGPRGALLLAVAALLLFVVIAARGESPVPTNLPSDIPDRGSLPLSPMGGGNDSGTGTGPPGDAATVGLVVGGVAALFLLVAVVSLILQARKRRPKVRVGEHEEPQAGTLDLVSRAQVTRAVADARELLARAGGVPTDAVIAAWLTLERATEHGRAPHETATEFTVALLTRESADPDALRELRELYQRARFGPRDATTDDVEDARDALDRILATVR